MFGGILFVSLLVLVFMLMLDVYAIGFLRRKKCNCIWYIQQIQEM